MELNLEEMSAVDRLKLWLPQARSVATKARDGQEVMQFLVSKGISESLAGETAAELWSEVQKSRVWWKSPRHWIGGGLMTSGILLVSFSFLLGGGVLAAIAACGFVGLGAAVFWGGYLERS